MKKKIIYYSLIILLLLISGLVSFSKLGCGFTGCSKFGCAAIGCGKSSGDANGPAAGDPSAQREIAYNSDADQDIQQRNLEEWKKRAVNRFQGDTIDLWEHILKTYPKGSYLMDCDRTLRYNIPPKAVLYQRQSNALYVFALIAKSKEDDLRLIEEKNIIGYDASYIDFDSTELGTAFFWLTLFKYDGGFTQVWESPLPSHGGFNRLFWEVWSPKKIPYVRANFHYASGSGHIDYNFFMVDGIDKPPHLLMTYEGINLKRTIIDVDHDNYPDYCEFLYYDTGDRVISPDSVNFVWIDTAYFSTRNKKQWRKY